MAHQVTRKEHLKRYLYSTKPAIMNQENGTARFGSGGKMEGPYLLDYGRHDSFDRKLDQRLN